MSTKDEAVRGSIGTAVNMGVIHIFLRLYEVVPIHLVSHYILWNASEDKLVVSFLFGQ